MKLKNRAARLISINHMSGDDKVVYRILPGDNPAVDVPDAVCKKGFVKALIESGDLAVVLADDDADEELDALREQAEQLGVKVDKRWKAERVQAEIDKALAAD